MHDSTILVEGFDVFDTVLTRKVSPPEAVFQRLGKSLAGRFSPALSAGFLAAQRRQAEARCMVYFRQSTNIDKIYDELANTLSLDEELRKQLRDEEFELEKQLTYVVPAARRLLLKARERGRKVVFISDTYLPGEMLRALLEYHGILEHTDSVYASCDFGADKWTGELYPLVLEAEGISPACFQFHGNSLHSDVMQARRHGVQAHHHTGANSSSFETILGRFSDTTAGLSNKFAGASRHARLHVAAHSVHELSIRDVAAGVAAPMLVSFVTWLLQRANALGLKRLYFLSRDGQILLQIANRLRVKLSLDIEFRYLYSSRTAWNRSARSEKVRGWIWSDIESTTTLRDILSRMDVVHDDFSAELAGIGFSRESIDAPLSVRDIRALRTFWESDHVQARLAELGRINREVLNDYFRQELLFDSVAKGIVDIGWIGTLHETLSEFVQKNDAPPVHGFFYGLSRYDTDWKEFRHGFHYDHSRGLGPLLPLPYQDLHLAAEIFCGADHGSVYGFARTDSGISPLLEQGWPEQAMEWGLQLYRETIMSFVGALEINTAEAEQIAVMRPAIDRALQLFWLNPGLAEAQAWGSYPWDAGQGNEKLITPLAAPVGIGQLARLTLAPNRTNAFRENSWFEASLRLSSPAARHLYRSLLLARKILRKLLYVCIGRFLPVRAG